jgi:hypothetical protein
MSRPSVPLSKRRPDYSRGEQALTILGEQLKATGMYEKAHALYDSAPSETVRLPGFDLFTVGNRSPYEWCVPKPRDAEQVINVYEEYVDRKLGSVAAPERVAKGLYGSHKVAKAYFGDSPRPASQWYAPLAKVIAAALHFEAQVEHRGRTISGYLLGYTLLASPSSVHSNLQRATLVTAGNAVDFGPLELSVPDLRTRHPLANTLVAIGADDACLWAANTAIRADERGVVNIKEDLFTPAEKKKVLTAAERRLKIDTIRAAALEASEVALGHPRPVTALYEVMVPALCSAQVFKTRIADPWKHPGRLPRPETRNSWVAHIESISTEALHALA